MNAVIYCRVSTKEQVQGFSLASQGINQGEISGLSFDNAGNLWVASTQGQIYRVDLRVDTAAVVTPTLSSDERIFWLGDR